MSEDTVEHPKKRRTRSDKGVHRGPRQKASVPAPAITLAPEPEAPIHVRVVLKNSTTPVEFGCASRSVENGFHVFSYPSERDRWRQTRREIAVSEIVEIEITEARQQPQIPPVYDLRPPPRLAVSDPPAASTGPKIHSVRKNAAAIMQGLETSSGPIRMDVMPSLTFGDEAPPGLLAGGE